MRLQDFESHSVDVGDDIAIFAKSAGSGPPVLLLHGYPQTHMCWHKVAPQIVEAGYRVIVPDLRGYGASSKPASNETHAPYSKRAMAQDQLALMRNLGHERFLLVGHDRGGRVAHRLAADHSDAVEKLAIVDIAPTLAMYEGTDMAFARAYYHWFFLIQPSPLPEQLIGAEAEFFLKRKLKAWASSDAIFSKDAMTSYLDAFKKPETIHASCEDYRASASIDLDHARADIAEGRKIQCPVLSLWGARGFAAKSYDMLQTWQEVSSQTVTGEGLDCGHFVPEEKPAETTKALLNFFAK